MTEQQAAMRQALEALEYANAGMNECHNEVGFDFANEQHDVEQAITAIREALAEQPAQEPVFKFQMQLKPGWGSQYPTPCVIGDPDLRSLFGKVGDVVTFYTSPQPAQPSKPWVGLTEEDYVLIHQLCEKKLEAAEYAEHLLREKNA